MAIFDNVIGGITDVFSEVGETLGDVFTDIAGSATDDSESTGETLGSIIGYYFGGSTGSAIGGEIGGSIGAAVDDDKPKGSGITEADVAGSVTQQDYDNLAAMQDQIDFAQQQPTVYEGQVYTAGFPAIVGTGAQNVPPFITGAVVGGAMDILDQVTEFFTGDDAPSYSGMGMCKPAKAKPFGVSANGCITITRKQQAKLKELVRMVGIEQAAKTIGLSVPMTAQLLMKTFAPRRKGISGADIRAVKRVDRQMHSLACALGGISQTSRAVASRKAPAKRSC